MNRVAAMPSGFGRVLRVLRSEAGLSQQQLAVAAGLSVSFVAKLEQTDSDPSWTTVQKIARALGVDCNAFANLAVEGGESVPEKPARKRKGE